MSRKVGTEVEVFRNVSEKWEVVFRPEEDGVEEQEHVRCKRMGPSYARLVRFCGKWPQDIQNDSALAPMRAAAEHLWWQNKTPGKDECRDSGRNLWQMRTAKFDGVECRFHDGKEWKPWSTVRLGYAFYALLAWHRANYVLADDEHYGPDGPAKMRDDQVRCVDGSVEQLHYSRHCGPDVNLDATCSYKYFLEGFAGPNHPMHIPSQRARIEAFLARNVKANEDIHCSPVCIIDDDGDRLEMSKHHGNTKGWLTVTGGRSGRSSGVYLSASDLRKLAETATKIADRIEGKPAGRPVPIE